MRESYWDNWRGVAIFAVVAIHASGATGGFDAGSFNWYFGLVLRQFIDFAVPLFLAIAGYFSIRGSEGSPTSYYSARLKRVLFPYLFWTAIYLVLRTPSAAPTIEEIGKGVILGTGIGIGYFVIVLIQFILITPFLWKIQSKVVHISIMIVMSAIGCSFIYYVSIIDPTSIFSRFPLYAIPFFVWYPFYHMGYFIAKYKKDLSKLRTPLIYALIGFLTVSIIEGVLWGYSGNYSFGVSQLKASSLAFSLVLFILIVSRSKNSFCMSQSSFLAWLGLNSYPIYLMHILPLGVTRKLLSKVDMIYLIQPVFILLSTVISIALCCIVIVLTKRFLPISVTKRILGS